MKQYTKSAIVILMLVNSAQLLWAQTLSLKMLYQYADEANPLVQQKLYYQSINELKSHNAANTNLPQLSINGQFTYQSDVFTLPFSSPAADIPEIPKDQYQLTLNVQQKIFDGSSSRHSKNLAKAELEANQEMVDVALYQIREVINQLFFSGLILQENIKIIETTLQTLQSQLEEINSGIENGVLLPSTGLILKKEIIGLEQNLISLQKDWESSIIMLSAWSGKEIPAAADLQVPEIDNAGDGAINRPESKLFELQARSLDATKALISIRNHPKIFAFINGGIGSPNPYNFFETDLAGFYLAGIKLQWNLFDWGSKNNDLEMLEMQKNILSTKKTDFERKVLINVIREDQEIDKLEALIEKDREIIELQKAIISESYLQLQNGVITSTEYITEVNKGANAEISAKIHELNLIKAKINKLNKTGNY